MSIDLREALFRAEKYSLLMPAELVSTPTDQVAELIPHGGGCGPGRLGDKLVPDRIMGINVKPACAVHDYMYYMAERDESEKTRQLADLYFLLNMLIIIRKESKSRILRRMRMFIAVGYFDAVDIGGGGFVDV